MGGNKDVEYVYCVAKAKLFFLRKSNSDLELQNAEHLQKRAVFL